MTRIRLEVERSAVVAASLDDTWAAVDTVPAMTSLMASVVSCEPIEGGWRWDLGQHGAVGITVHVVFDVAVTHRPKGEIDVEPLGTAGKWARGGSRVSLREVAPGEHGRGGTVVEVDLTFDLDLPVPRLLAGPVSKVVRRDVADAVDDFLRRLRAQVAG